MKDLMVDIECLGKGSHPVVVQIGACYFDQHSGEIGKEFIVNIDAKDAENNGATTDADTVLWWLKQSKIAIDSVFSQPSIPEVEAFYALSEFWKPADRIWSHVTFDAVILLNAFKRLKIPSNASYKKMRDIRTLVTLSSYSVKSMPREGIHHNALDDCKHQVKYCSASINALRKK